MRLTQALTFYIRYRKVQGLIRYGKDRVIPPISVDFKRRVAELMVIEKQNLDVLNQPYLTQAEENAYYRVVDRVPYKNKEQLKREEVREKLEALPPHFTTETLLAHLNKDKKWE
ncbi:unnamed protein product [Candidula unifasciata]|uniref:Uncharacterized protein n=1 Tax=Candidula unifasciata TaxID=100452 RepID=A0A8S3ZL02_9EUPU|nr:unnamed protein product [Candidula unifasciata]